MSELQKVILDFRARVLANEPVTLDEMRKAFDARRIQRTAQPEPKVRKTREKKSSAEVLKDLGF